MAELTPYNTANLAESVYTVNGDDAMAFCSERMCRDAINEFMNDMKKRQEEVQLHPTSFKNHNGIEVDGYNCKANVWWRTRCCRIVRHRNSKKCDRF